MTSPQKTGAGKSTLAKAIANNTTTAIPPFTRLSVDTILHAQHGLYNINYPASEYSTHLTSAAADFHSETMRLLRTTPPTNLVLDRSFYAKEDRDEYRTLAEQAGARVVLVYLKATREVLWRRICARKANAESEGRDADSAFDVSEEVLERYLGGWETPVGEGEVVVVVS
jgi:predicted kinase